MGRLSPKPWQKARFVTVQKMFDSTRVASPGPSLIQFDLGSAAGGIRRAILRNADEIHKRPPHSTLRGKRQLWFRAVTKDIVEDTEVC